MEPTFEEHVQERAVLVGLNADLFTKEQTATDESLEELEAGLPDDRFAPDMSDEEIGKLISGFLRGQKEDVRNVFIRKYYFFDPVGEIAKRYGFTESKVKNMLFHTRNKLKDFLIGEGVEI